MRLKDIAQVLPEGVHLMDPLTEDVIRGICRKLEDMLMRDQPSLECVVRQRTMQFDQPFPPALVYPTPDPKYSIVNNRIVNSATLEPVPPDEGMFMLRFKDRRYLPTVDFYMHQCENFKQREAVYQGSYLAGMKFAQEKPWRLKEPDTVMLPGKY